MKEKKQGFGTFNTEDYDSDKADFDLVPSGEYLVEVEEQEFKVSENTGNPYINLQLNIVAGDQVGRKLFKVLSLTQKAGPFTKKALQTFLGDDFQEGEYDFEGEDSQCLVGCKAIAVVSIKKADENYDQDRNEVKRFKSAASAEDNLNRPPKRTLAKTAKPASGRKGGF